MRLCVVTPHKEFCELLASGGLGVVGTDCTAAGTLQVSIEPYGHLATASLFCYGGPVAGQGWLQNWDLVSPTFPHAYSYTFMDTAEAKRGQICTLAFMWDTSLVQKSAKGDLAWECVHCSGLHGFAPQKFSGEMRTVLANLGGMAMKEVHPLSPLCSPLLSPGLLALTSVSA